MNKCYISNKFGNGRRGIPHLEETKRKISLAHTGKSFSESHKQKISDSGKLAWITAKQMNHSRDESGRFASVPGWDRTP